MPEEEKKEAHAQTSAAEKVFVKDYGYLKIYRRPDGQYEVWDGDQRIGESYPNLEAAELAADGEILAAAAKGPGSSSKSEEKKADNGPASQAGGMSS